MKAIKSIFRWILVGFVAIVALGALFSGGMGIVGALLLALSAFLVMPLPFVSNIRKKIKLGKFITVVLIIALFISGVWLTPTSDYENDTQNISSDYASSQNSSIPADSSNLDDSSTPIDSSSSVDSSEIAESSEVEESSEPASSSEVEESSEPTSSAHTHVFSDATCLNPKTCSCGETDGDALGHNYSNATCTQAQKCSRCGETKGSAKGHDWKPATCTAPKTCKTCGETEGSAVDHSWAAATCNAPQKCKTCSAEKGSATGHNYRQGTCTTCGSKDPNYNEITYVLNTHSKKFHKPSCSRLPTDNRKDTTMSRDEVVAQGYVACGVCHP